MSCGIYLLTFKDGSVYIGKSKNISGRLTKHLLLFKRGTHSKKLMCAYRAYGVPELTILKLCNRDWLDYLEAIYYSEYPKDLLLNTDVLVNLPPEHIIIKIKSGAINVKIGLVGLLGKLNRPNKQKRGKPIKLSVDSKIRLISDLC